MSTQSTVLDDAVDAARPSDHFANFLQLDARIPQRLWSVARGVTLLITLSLMLYVVMRPSLGLNWFWGVVVPSVPLLLVLAPGFWRQVCPMALLNQTPRKLGWSLDKTLPEAWQRASFGVALALFIGAVALRAPLLNHSGVAVAGVLTGMLTLAFVGGLVFKGRSGWCGTFCPLGPIQRAYGQAPVALVRNGHCSSCVGCQPNCYDFNPRLAVFQDIEHDDPRHAGMRQAFFGLLPGLILAYFLQGPRPQHGIWVYEATLLGGCLASLGLYTLLARQLPTQRYRLSLAFAAAALIAFYWFAGPGIVGRLASLTPLPALTPFKEPAHLLGLVAGGLLLLSGLRSERHYRLATARQAEEAAKRQAQWKTIAIHPVTVTNRADGQRSQVMPGQKLTDALRQQGTALPTGCGVGMCGGDAVLVTEGLADLPPPCAQEQATLKRMGLEGRARLACMCEVTTPITVDTRREALLAPAADDPTRVDPLTTQAIDRVVVIGNGVAGITLAEALRRRSPGVHLTVLSDEPHPFYNRMALAELLPAPEREDTLHLRHAGWATDMRIDLQLAREATRIDRTAQQVVLADGSTLPYDRLVLAMGADAARPNDAFSEAPNAFVMRTVRDMQHLHRWIADHHSQRAVIVGGGVLGVEAALALRHHGLEVSLIERAPRIMATQLDEPGACRLTDVLRLQGIQVETRVEGLAWLTDGEPPARMRALALHRTHNGQEVVTELAADVFVACLGIRPRSTLAMNAGLAVQPRGIVTDTEQRTSDPLIYAIGDVAEPQGPAGLWTVAAAQADRAAQSLLGEPPEATADAPITFKLKSKLMDVVVWGDTQPRADDIVWTAPESAAMHWRIIWRDDRLIGWLCVGALGSAEQVEQATQAGSVEAVYDALHALSPPNTAQQPERA